MSEGVVPPSRENVFRAAQAILRGCLVGLPTETVYGIAANALDAEAVRSIYRLKGRPAENPLIVHLAGLDGLASVAREVPKEAMRLAEAFWPGPLTLVLPKLATIPDEVTSGLDTVAVRVPAHPVAKALLDACGVPLAAPSANPFMGVSPTRPVDIDPAIASGLELILDGGPCSVGIESTVVDCSGAPFRILRPGGVPRSAIEELIPDLQTYEPARLQTSNLAANPSPGLYPRHYAPATPLLLAPKLLPADAGICLSEPMSPFQIRLPADPAAYAAALYSTLMRLDSQGHPEIVVEQPPDEPAWEAVLDRLRKAARV